MWKLSFIVGALTLLPFHAHAAEPNFRTHFIEKNASLVNDAVMSCVLVDLDNDGDLDWTVGTIWPKPRSQRTLFWYEFRSADNWVKHTIGKDREMYGGACAADVNRDGKIDVIATNLWLNMGKGSKWKFSNTGIGDGAHDLQTVDINGDDRLDVLAFTQTEGLNWFEIPKNPNKKWIKHAVGKFDFAGARVHAVGSPSACGDLDGDGDVDIAVVHGWFENTDGKGRQWSYRRNGLFPSGDKELFPWGFAVRTEVRDLDGDGDPDIIQSECDTEGPAGIVWLENRDGKGTFARHWIKKRGPEDFHSLQVFDYDGDGDLDVLSGTGPLAKSAKKHLYLFENLGPSQQERLQWKQHIIHSGMPIHEPRVGDVDGDGDIDIVIKPWNRKDHPKHFLFLENQRTS